MNTTWFLPRRFIAKSTSIFVNVTLNEIPLDYLFTLQASFWLLVNALDYLKNLYEIPVDHFKIKTKSK